MNSEIKRGRKKTSAIRFHHDFFSNARFPITLLILCQMYFVQVSIESLVWKEHGETPRNPSLKMRKIRHV